MSWIILEHATINPGATPEHLLAFEQRTGMKLPDSMRELYRDSDGLNLASLNTDFLPLNEIETYLKHIHDFGIPDLWRYVPFTESNDSNPYCICGGGPLAGCVIHLFHDDNALLEFRSFDSFLTELEKGISKGIEFLEELPGDFNSPTRTDHDLHMGGELIDLAKSLDEVEQADALRFAATLLREERLAGSKK